MKCCQCDAPVRIATPGIMREVRGWELVRAGGGANQIIKRQETGRLLCAPCGSIFRHDGHTEIEGQESLW